MLQKNWFTEDYLPIGGKRQYLLQYPCTKKEGPVVLFIHGGPGVSMSVLSHAFQGDLREYCTMVYWDLPGAGKTLTANPDSYPTMDQLMMDLFIVISCLKIKFNKKKIILMGHSFGTVLASLYVMKHPEDILCYIGAGQVVGLLPNEQSALSLLRDEITSRGNSRDMEKLKKLSPYPVSDPSIMKKSTQKFRALQRKYGIGMKPKQVIITMLKSPIFKWEDFSSLKEGFRHNDPLWEYLTGHSLDRIRKPWKVPAFYILGENDRLAPPEGVNRYIEHLDAPQKQIINIPDAGHYMMLDQPAAYIATIKEIVSQYS